MLSIDDDVDDDVRATATAVAKMPATLTSRSAERGTGTSRDLAKRAHGWEVGIGHPDHVRRAADHMKGRYQLSPQQYPCLEDCSVCHTSAGDRRCRENVLVLLAGSSPCQRKSPQPVRDPPRSPSSLDA